MSLLAQYKKARGSAIEALNAEINKLNEKVNTRQDDERLWYPSVDKAGNGNAIIRFLPAAPGETVPFVRLFTHEFQGPTGSWYIENCPTTIGKECPMCEVNNELWNSGVEENKKQVSRQKRKTNFYSNILILKDPANPENEGKVKLYKYGVKIFDKINELMHPSFDGEEPINPFDIIEGCNFKLKIRNVDGYRNYDKSEFDKVKALSEDEDYLESVLRQLYPLQPFIAPEQFKTKDELKVKVYRVLGLDKKPSLAVNNDEIPFSTSPPVSGKEVAAPKGKVADVSVDTSDELDEDFFNKLKVDD